MNISTKISKIHALYTLVVHKNVSKGFICDQLCLHLWFPSHLSLLMSPHFPLYSQAPGIVIMPQLSKFYKIFHSFLLYEAFTSLHTLFVISFQFRIKGTFVQDLLVISIFIFLSVFDSSMLYSSQMRCAPGSHSIWIALFIAPNYYLIHVYFTV